jgi:hypothetical protein
VGSLPVGAGSPDLSGEIWRLGFLLALFELRRPEQEAVKRATAPFNESAISVFQQVWLLAAVSSPLSGQGGKGRWRCVAGSALVRADRALLPPLAGLGGGGSGRCSSWRPFLARKLISGVVACGPSLPHPPSPTGRGGEGGSGWVRVLPACPRRHRSLKKLKLRPIPSGGEERRRYPWPRGPRRTSGAQAPRLSLFLQAFAPMRRILVHDTATHPSGEPWRSPRRRCQRPSAEIVVFKRQRRRTWSLFSNPF